MFRNIYDMVKYICVYFRSQLMKYYGLVQSIKSQEQALLPDDLRSRTTFATDHHEDPEDAARAVDK